MWEAEPPVGIPLLFLSFALCWFSITTLPLNQDLNRSTITLQDTVYTCRTYVCRSWCRLSVVFIETPCRPPPSPPPPWSGSTCLRRKIIHPHGLRHPRMRAQRGFYRCTREPAHHISPYVAMLSWMPCIQGVFNLSFKTLNVNTLNVKHP